LEKPDPVAVNDDPITGNRGDRVTRDEGEPGNDHPDEKADGGIGWRRCTQVPREGPNRERERNES
jgi:hypothetical protein